MVGRLNPKSGEIKLATSPTPRSNPYGMVIDSHGVPFFVEFGSNKVGRIDPDSLAIREYVLPNADARPRRVAITPDDMIWYSDYARGFLGRLDPKTGKVTEWLSPGGPNSRPYGITAVGDIIWYSESNISPEHPGPLRPRTQNSDLAGDPVGRRGGRNMVHTRTAIWARLQRREQIAFVQVGSGSR